MMEGNVTANINSADCIRSTTKFGETIYLNICNGQTHTVPWGGADWLACIVLGTIGVGMAVLLIAATIGAFRMVFDRNF